VATRKPRKPTTFKSTGEGVPPVPPNAEVKELRQPAPPKLERGIAGDGQAVAKVVFSRSQKHNVPFDMDVTFLLAFPNLFAAFVFAGMQLLGWKPNLSTATAWLRELKAGFLLFLKEKSLAGIHVWDISPVLVGAFITWLNQEDPRGIGARWGEPLRRKRFRSLLVILEKLRQSSEWKSAVDLAVNLRAVPWQGAGKKKDAGIGSPAKTLNESCR